MAKVNDENKKSGLLFDIQGFSVHDGPGCRTLVFLKGCPLRCGWCSNPEGISHRPDVMYHGGKCVGDHYSCIGACPNGAITFKDKGGPITINRSKCGECRDFKCADACIHDALQVSGFYLTVEELMKKIQRDRQYWGTGGGVTLSGGEPMSQAGFATEVLKKCHDSYIHTALETCGHVPWKHYKKALDYVDWIFFDIKHMDPAMHKKGTGVYNKLILENAGRIVSSLGNNNNDDGDGCRVVFRVPVIPGFNDSVENITATARFIKGVGKEEVNVLPFHNLGSTKYGMVGRKYVYKNARPPSPYKMKEIEDIFKAHSIKCYIGGLTPF